jgi:hypothetical protein
MLHPNYTAGFSVYPIHDATWDILCQPKSDSTTRAKARRLLKRQYARDQYAAALAKYKAMTPEQRKEAGPLPPLKIEDRGACTYQLSGRTVKMIFGHRGGWKDKPRRKVR